MQKSAFLSMCLLSKFLQCTQLLQYPTPIMAELAAPSFPCHPFRMVLVMKGPLWDISLWTSFFGRVLSGKFHQSRTTVASLPLRSHSYPFQQDLSPGRMLSRVLYLNPRGRGHSVCLLCISLYVYFPLVNLLLLHSSVVVNNSLDKLYMFKLLCGLYFLTGL